MKCLIPGINVKVLARAVHALAKIGDELYVEPLPEGISFRTVNSSRSAYASFTFDPSFFLHYSDGGSIVTAEEEDEDLVKCKISMKSCVAVFKSPNTIDKHVETCQLKLEQDDKKLIFQFRCRYGIIINHYLPIIECETLQAVYTKDMASNVLIAEPKLLVDALHNFQNNQEELTLAVAPTKITIRNFTDFAPEPHKVIRTELCLESGEFVQYNVGIESSITFCLKEFRALLSFSESVTMPVAINFETPGRPVVFVVSHPHRFEANFVLATLMHQSDSQQILTPATSSHISKKRASSINNLNERNYDLKRPRCVTAEKGSILNSASLTKETNKGFPAQSNQSEVAKDTQKNRINSHCTDSLDNLEEVFEMEWDNVNDDDDENLQEVDKTQKDFSGTQDKCNSDRLTQDQLETNSMDSGSRGLMDYSEQRESEVTILPTPSLSGVSMVYRRCFQETFNPANLPGYDEILAPDSDEEPD